MSEAFRTSVELSVSAPSGQPPRVRFDALASAALDVPGLALSVDDAGIGLVLSLDLTGEGALGFLDLALEPRPPSGASAELDIPGVSGGGYLAHVDDEMRGMLSANLGVVRVTGYGILGTDKFSLLVLLAAEFLPPIQLSFGFTLAGVGGIVGINRRANIEAIGRAVSSGDLSKLLFPQDPVGEAPQLLSSLSSCFPYDDGGFVIGPFVKIGWSTPTIASATAGVIISTADSGISIVGRLAVSLPFEDLPIVHLEATFVATINADGFALDASLSNSRLAMVEISGDLRIRMLTGPKALFAISAGGFHPSFTPPDGMAGMRRVGASLSPGPILSLRLDAYAAITSSSLQFGARVDLKAGIDGFGITGNFAFDALFVTEPTFGFQVSLSASISVVCFSFEVASIRLRGELAGPAPWRIRGSASISLLFFEVDIDIPTIQWGSSATPPLPARDPLAALVESLRRPEAWGANATAIPAVAVLRPGVSDDMSAVHPLAGLQVRQKAVPLDTAFARMDGRTMPKQITAQVRSSRPASPLRESFVPNQFFDIAQDRQLATAGFIDLPGGLDFGAAAPSVGPVAGRVIQEEVRILEAGRRWPIFTRDVAEVFLGTTEPAAPEPLVEVFDPVAAIADTDNLLDRTAEFSDRAGQMSMSEALLIADSVTSKNVQVVAAWEVGL
ncbi:MAG: hypothetical protein KAZ88_10485 [Acidimicrobiia bacterium]|nr:hypothetical protein [Acidimicrobiia bacterium]